MTERPQPYIGISGVGSISEQLYIRSLWEETRLHEAGRLALLGVKSCSNQYADEPNRRGRSWYPVGEGIKDVITDPSEDEFPVLQTYFGDDRHDVPGHVTTATEIMIDRTKSWARGIQYDIFPWTADEHTVYLRRLKKAHPELSIIVQCYGAMMEELGPVDMIKMLSQRSDIIDYALFDASCGEGIQLSADHLRPFVDCAYSSDQLSTMGFGVAGGLHGGNVEALAPLLVDHPDLSFDSESKLHYQEAENAGALKKDVVRNYLITAAELLWGTEGRQPLA